MVYLISGTVEPVSCRIHSVNYNSIILYYDYVPRNLGNVSQVSQFRGPWISYTL